MPGFPRMSGRYSTWFVMGAGVVIVALLVAIGYALVSRSRWCTRRTAR